MKRSPNRRIPVRRASGFADLDRLRDAVARVDADIMNLLARRLVLARRIGRVKRGHELPVKDFQVEKLVITRNRLRAGRLGLAPAAADEISKLLIELAIRVQDEDRRAAIRRIAVSGESVLVVGGLGGMGRWLARFFDSLGHRVTVLDRPSVRARTEFPRTHDLSRAAIDHSVIVLATPIEVTAGLLERIAETSTKALLFDVCSLKGPLRGAIERALAAGLRVASIHPLFGPDAEVLAGSNILLCRTRGVDHSAEVGRFFHDTTTRLVTVPIERHDELMGYVLGLSHLTSLVFARALAASGLSYADLAAAGSTTFAAQTKVSRAVSEENQDLYFEIQADSAATPAMLRRFSAAFDAYAAAIGTRDRRRFKTMMESTRAFFQTADRPRRRRTGGRQRS